jgi:cytidylate kinase
MIKKSIPAEVRNPIDEKINTKISKAILARISIIVDGVVASWMKNETSKYTCELRSYQTLSPKTFLYRR